MKGVVCFFLFLFFVSFLSSYSSESDIVFIKGENYVNLNLTRAVYVSDIVRVNPDIEYVFDYNYEKVYINVFDGIGDDFIVYDQNIKIVSGKNISFVFPF